MNQKHVIKVNTSVKGIILLTLPISLAKLVPELNYLLDSVFLGHLGSKELALAGLTGVYYLIFSAVGFGLNNALLSIMSRRAGEGSRNQIFSTLWHGLAVGTTFALLTIGFTHLFIDDILLWSGVEKMEAEMAAGFLRIRIWGLIFLFAYQMQNAYIISLQKSKYLLFGAIGIALVNMGLNYLLIFGMGGFPKMGFNGAALASVFAEFAGMVIVFLVIRWTKLSKKYKIRYQWTLHSKTMLLVFKQGLPLMGQYAISLVAWWIFFILINRNYDVEEQAVSQVMRNLFGLSGIFTWSFGSTANTVLSNLLGQGKSDEFFKIMNKIIRISLIGTALFAILINLFPGIFFGLFGQDDGFYESGVEILRIVSAAMLLISFGVIWLNAVVATGNTFIVFWIEAIGIIIYLVYIYLVMEHFHLDLRLAWMSEWIYWLVMMFLSILYLKRGKWKTNALQ